jgi:hypothetical protein
MQLYYFNRACGNTGTSCVCRDENPMPRTGTYILSLKKDNFFFNVNFPFFQKKIKIIQKPGRAEQK